MTPEEHIGKIFVNKNGVKIKVTGITKTYSSKKYVGEVAEYLEIKKEYYSNPIIFTVGELMNFDVSSFDYMYKLIEEEEVL